jgi:hypothetical protein
MCLLNLNSDSQDVRTGQRTMDNGRRVALPLQAVFGRRVTASDPKMSSGRLWGRVDSAPRDHSSVDRGVDSCRQVAGSRRGARGGRAVPAPPRSQLHGFLRTRLSSVNGLRRAVAEKFFHPDKRKGVSDVHEKRHVEEHAPPFRKPRK